MDLRIKNLLSRGRPLVIAHRGFSLAAPENTSPSFRLALTAGADLVELDYYQTADGVPVVFHDRTIGRTTDAVALWGRGDASISDLSLAEIQKLDAGSWFDVRFAGTAVLSLADALSLIQARAVTLIEHKEGDPRTLFDLLQSKGMLNGVFVQSYDWSFLTTFHELAPEVPLGALGPPSTINGRRLSQEEKALSHFWLDMLQTTGASMACWNTQVDRVSIEEAHRRGLRVWCYVINDLDMAFHLLDLNVDGLITDNPALGWKALALHRLSLD